MKRIQFPARKPPRARLAVLLAIASLLAPIVSLADLAGEWPTYGGGPEHTGYIPGSLDGAQFVLKWQAAMPNWHISQAATGGGEVFVTTGWYFGLMWLKALDAGTGQELWSKNLGSAYAINPPTYDSGAVYVERIQPSSTFSFDAVTGANNWTTAFTSQAHDYMAPVVVNGTVYAGTGYYVDLTAYNQTSGSEKFSVSLIGDGCDQWTPAFYGGKCYTWVNGYFTEHDASTGARNWTLTNATQSEFLYSMNRTVAIANGRAYFTSTTKLIAVDLALKTNLWQIQGQFSGTPAIANGTIYVISNNVINAYTTEGGYLKTYGPTNWGSFSGQLIVTDDSLIAANDSGVFVFKLSDATVQQYISSYRTNCYCYYGSAISLANNTLYIASGDSILYAYATAPHVNLSIEKSGPGPQLLMKWPSELGKSYVVWFATNLNPAAFVPVSTNLATPPLNALSSSVTSFPLGFYRLSAQTP